MDCKKLRIGNIIKHKELGDEVEVGGIASEVFFTNNMVYFDLFEFEGSPLNEDYLTLFGFEILWCSYVSYFDNYRAKMFIKRAERKFEIRIKRNNTTMWISTIEYVHQLQNIWFYLTNTELTIKNFKHENNR